MNWITFSELGRIASQQSRGHPLFFQKSHGSFIEGDEDIPAEPLAFESDDAIGEVPAGLKNFQSRLGGGAIDFDIGRIQQRADRLGDLWRSDP